MPCPVSNEKRPRERRLPNANDLRPAPVKGPPQENERAAEYALPRKRQEIRGRKVKEKPRAATARQVVSERDKRW